jgi:putative transposase
MQRSETFCVGEYYHIYNRGVDKRIIFNTEHDKRRFQRCLYVYNGQKNLDYLNVKKQVLPEIDKGDCLVSIGAYCLMGNHFHILVKEITEGGISKFMKKLMTSYSMYFNKLNNRTGCLLENRFKASHVDNDVYLKHLFAYIHLNPAKFVDKDWKTKNRNREKIFNFLNVYKYSSFKDYQGEQRELKIILSEKDFPEYFFNKADHQNFILDWLDINNLDKR